LAKGALIAVILIAIVGGWWLWNAGYLNDLLGMPTLTLQPSNLKQGSTVTSIIKNFPNNTQIWANQYTSNSPFIMGTTDKNGYLIYSNSPSLTPGTYPFSVWTSDYEVVAFATLKVYP